MWAGKCSPYSDWLRAGRLGGSNTCGGKFLPLVQTGHRTQTSSCTMRTGLFAACKTIGAWLWPPAPSSVVVKERVELYFYSPSGPFMAGCRVKFYNTYMCAGLDIGLQSNMEVGFMWFAGKCSLLLVLLTTVEIEPENFHKSRREAMISRYKHKLKHAQNFDDCIACLKGKYDISLRNTSS